MQNRFKNLNSSSDARGMERSIQPLSRIPSPRDRELKESNNFRGSNNFRDSNNFRGSNNFRSSNNFRESKQNFTHGDNKSKNMFKYKQKINSKEIKTSNLFKCSSTPPDFNIEKEHFPNINSQSSSVAPSTSNYLDKIKSQKEKDKVTSNIPKGYIILSQQKFTKKPPKSKDPLAGLSMPTPYTAQLIMDNRRQYREELNEILGDISPYWNLLNDDDDDDIDYYSDEEQSYTDDENYDLDEW